MKAAGPVLGNPANRKRAVPLTFEQFRFAFANVVSEEEAKQLYETFAVPASGEPLFQAATANLDPWTEANVDTKNPDRGPMKIVSGEKDHTVPWAIANASYKRQEHNPGVTEIEEIPNRGTLADDRQRLEGSRRKGAGVRAAIRLSVPTFMKNRTSAAAAGDSFDRRWGALFVAWLRARRRVVLDALSGGAAGLAEGGPDVEGLRRGPVIELAQSVTSTRASPWSMVESTLTSALGSSVSQPMQLLAR